MDQLGNITRRFRENAFIGAAIFTFRRVAVRAKDGRGGTRRANGIHVVHDGFSEWSAT